MSSLTTVVEAVVDSKVASGEMFTAHDVTIEVRNRGHRAKHDEVRDAVHDYYGRGGLGIAYTRTNITVPGGGQPYLYHRSVEDPATYSNVRGGQATGASSPAPPGNQSVAPAGQTIQIPVGLLNTPASVAGVAVAKRAQNTPGTAVGRKVDGRGTLSIPSPLLRRVGLNPGDKVYAIASNNFLFITPDAPLSFTVYGKYTVDKASQVRVTQSLLKRAGLGGNKYDVTVQDGTVGVKSVVTVKLHN